MTRKTDKRLELKAKVFFAMQVLLMASVAIVGMVNYWNPLENKRPNVDLWLALVGSVPAFTEVVILSEAVYQMRSIGYLAKYSL